ncbi:MAG: acyl-CoA dehydrogenase family protein [Deltaproteobacteria bacterium]|jgi:acyl-CoA dehydrogenase|nr:acyl-CoA dehydrogenase family protein [Deltaproteobacteria bacterium]
MDIFQNEMIKGLTQMAHYFAEFEIRPAAPIHDREETVPWELMAKAQFQGISQTRMLDEVVARRGKEVRESDSSKPKIAAQLQVAAAEELAWGCAGCSLALVGSSLAASPVASLGSVEQQDLFLKLMDGLDANGRVKTAAMALSEPGTGSDISGLSTTARKEGDSWVINGSKQWITNGQTATVYVVWAQTDAALGRSGVRGFLVERGTPGLVPGKKEHKIGIRASETAAVHFEECRVHNDMLLGAARPSTGGLGDTKKMLDSTRPAVGAGAVGIARAAYEYTLEFAQREMLRGRKLVDHQHIAFALAEMAMEIEASRLLIHKAAWLSDNKIENVLNASIGKAHAANTATSVTRRCLEILGDAATEPGNLVEKCYRDAKIYDIFEGTGQIQRRIIAKHLFGVNAV